MKKTLSLLLTGIMFCTVASAQSKITGKIQTADQQPAAEVSIQLTEHKIAVLSDESGRFIITDLKPGTYTLFISNVGLYPATKTVVLHANETIDLHFLLQENAQELEAVIVNASKGLNNHTISAGKIAVDPMNLPQGIAVINQTTIRNQQAQKLSDIVKNVNGVYLSTTRGSTSETFSARGYRFGAGNLYKNGARLSTGTMPEISGIQKVEVLKGSAAILYGDVSPGGIMNLVTKQPKFNFGGELAVRTGSFGLWKPMFDVYGPVSNKIAFRINGTYERADSYRDQVKTKKFYINPSVVFKLNNRTSLLLQTDYLDHDFTPDFGIGSLDNTLIANVSRGNFVGTAWQYNSIKQNNSTLTLNHQINTTWNLNATAAMQYYERDYYSTERVQAAANGDWARPLNKIYSEESDYSTSFNLTGKFKTNKINHRLLVGIDAIRTVTTSYQFDNPKIYDTINILDPNKFTARTDIPQANKISSLKTPTDQTGIYVQDLIELSDKLNVLAGVRWSYQLAEANQTRYFAKDSLVKGNSTNNNAFSPRFGIVYKPLKTLSLFASYSNSFSLNKGADVFGNALDPSLIDQYELGIKNEFFQKKLSLNVTLYRIVNNNLAQTAEYLADGTTENNDANIKELAGQTTSKGIELDLEANPVAGLQMMAGYSYNDMRYTETTEAKGNYIEGERLVNNPTHTANSSIFYTFQSNELKGLKLGITGQYVGNRLAGWNNKQGQTQSYNRLIKVEGFTSFDMSIGYQFKQISLLAKLGNVFNSLNYYVHENYSINPIPPRNITATLSYTF